MQKSAFEPCIPTKAAKVPNRPEWIHEVKHDGYRLMVQRDGKRVRLFTRNGHDWSSRYPRIVEAALRNRNSSFVLDGEAVLLGVDGVSDFNGLHSRRHDHEVEFYAFDMMVSDGEDTSATAAVDAQDQPAPAAGPPRRRHSPGAIRSGRDRAGPIPPRLPDGAGGAGFEAPRPAVSARQIAALGQGEEHRCSILRSAGWWINTECIPIPRMMQCGNKADWKRACRTGNGRN